MFSEIYQSYRTMQVSHSHQSSQSHHPHPSSGQGLSLSPFRPYAAASERAPWKGLDDEWRRETVAMGEEYLGCTYPYLSATDFMDFSRTGNRVRFEDKYFRKHHMLNALVLAECVENEGRFMDDIVNGIFSICEESCWQLPAHNTYIRDTPQLPLPDCQNPVLDLFACETGAILAAVYYLLKEKLKEVSPFILERIMRELQQRIFAPYLNRHFWWMGDGQERLNNWTIWCTQNVLLSVFLSDSQSEVKQRVLEKACQSTDYFLAEYGEDGCCDEGAQYYRHAGLCLFRVMELLNEVTAGAFAPLYGKTKIRNMASYIFNVHVDDKYYINFADCSPIAGRAGVCEFLFAKRTGNENMARFAAQDFCAGGTDSLLLPKENNLFYRLENGFHVKEIKAYVTSCASSLCTAPVPHPDIYYPSVGLFIARDEKLCLAVKAGDNGDSHNHNDTGSFTVYKNGLPLFIDVGVESYTQKTFSPKRYEIWTMQSSFHNLPTVNGIMQADGEAYRAEDVRWHMDDSFCEIEMELASAYPAESGLASYKRKAALYKGEKIVIKDWFAFRSNASAHALGCGSSGQKLPGRNIPEEFSSAPVILSLMTYEKPVLLPGDPFSSGPVFQIGNLGQLKVVSGRFLQTEAIPITDARLKPVWEHEIYRTSIVAADSYVEMHIC